MLSIDYIAGFIDGEGCFDTYISPRGISLSIAIVNTNSDILQEISDTVYKLTDIAPRKIVKRKGSCSFDSYKRKDVYTLKIGSPALRILLPILLPSMVVKKYQAETMLELISLTPTRESGNNRVGRDSHWEDRVRLVDKIQWANQGFK